MMNTLGILLDIENIIKKKSVHSMELGDYW